MVNAGSGGVHFPAIHYRNDIYEFHFYTSYSGFLLRNSNADRAFGRGLASQNSGKTRTSNFLLCANNFVVDYGFFFRGEIAIECDLGTCDFGGGNLSINLCLWDNNKT